MIITNWDKWQSFRKDRGTPPWIKIYRNLLSNEQWVELSDSEKGQLVSIWILAADKNGIIPDSPKMIQRMAMLDSPPNLNKFIQLGFLASTCQPPDNHELDLCPQLDAPEESRGEESREEKSKEDSAEKEPAFNFKKELLALGVDKEILSDYMLVRKNKKATNTKTALNGLLNEIKKSGLTVPDAIERSAKEGWSGFKANWLNKEQADNYDFMNVEFTRD